MDKGSYKKTNKRILNPQAYRTAMRTSSNSSLKGRELLTQEHLFTMQLLSSGYCIGAWRVRTEALKLNSTIIKLNAYKRRLLDGEATSPLRSRCSHDDLFSHSNVHNSPPYQIMTQAGAISKHFSR